MNILPQTGPSLGEVIGQGLSDLAGHWGNIRSTEKALKGLGFSPAQAKAYAHLSPQMQQQALQGQQKQEAQQASNAAINQILGAGLPQNQPYQQPIAASPSRGQKSMAQSIQLPHEQQQAALQQATGIAQNPALRKVQEQQQAAQALQQQQLAPQQGPQGQPQITGEQAAILQSQQQKEPTLKEQIEQIRNKQRALAAANLPVNQTLALYQQLQNQEKELRKEDRENRKEAREERKLTAAEQRDVNKETLPTYHEVNKASKSAKDSNIRLGRMEELINHGKLTGTAFYNGIKALGKLPGVGGFFESVAESFLSPDTQEFEKLSTDFIKDAKQFFGSRITQQEVLLFLKTVPNLSQTNPGKKRVIRNMRIFNEASELRKKAMDKLIKNNNGNRPSNLEALIEQEVSPQLDSLAEEFKGALS